MEPAPPRPGATTFDLGDWSLAGPVVYESHPISVASRFFTAASVLRKKDRQVFVAYPYRLYDKRDYRPSFTRVGKAFGVDFVFADEKITNLHILEKIENYIRESQFGIYDISGWNANVTLELGLAFGLDEPALEVRIAAYASKTIRDAMNEWLDARRLFMHTAWLLTRSTPPREAWEQIEAQRTRLYELNDEMRDRVNAELTESLPVA